MFPERGNLGRARGETVYPQFGLGRWLFDFQSPSALLVSAGAACVCVSSDGFSSDGGINIKSDFLLKHFAGQDMIVFREIYLCKAFGALGEYFCTGTGQKYERQIPSRSLLPQHLWVTAAAETKSLKSVKSLVFARIDISSRAAIRVDLAGGLGNPFPRGRPLPLRCWLN